MKVYVASQYWMLLDHKLYNNCYLNPYLMCVHPKKVQDVLFELHEVSYGSHAGGRSLA